MSVRAFVAVAVFAVFVGLVGLWPAQAITPSSARASASPTVGPPHVTLPDNSPLGAIGTLERNRSTAPSKLAAFLQSTDPAVAARAAVALGRLRNPAGVPLLVAVVGNASEPEQVRAAAAFALGVIASPDGLPALTRATSDVPSVAGAAADSIGRIGGDRASSALVPLLRAGDPFVRGKAAIGLGEVAFAYKSPLTMNYRLGASRALSAALTSESNPEVRWRIAWAIGRSYYASAQSTLLRMLADKQELVRMMALKGIAKLGDNAYAVPVRLLKADSSWRVRVEVRNTLLALKDSSTIVDVHPPPIPAADQATPQPLAKGAPYGDHPQVALVTDRGTIVIEMFPDEAPYNVDSFLHLVDSGVYNKNALFRVIWDFVIQGGGYHNDPDANPPYTVPAEANPLEQLTGMLALGLDYDSKTNLPKYDSGGTQYYVTESPLLHLDEAFTTMGRVVKGMTVVYAIKEHSPTDGVKGADTVIRAYRCVPVTPQDADTETRLRTAEVDYQAP